MCYTWRAYALFFMFEIYSKTGCGYCDRLMEFMDSKGIEYTERKLGEDFIVEEFVNTFGRGSTFPRVKHDGELIGGMRETVLFLKQNNYV